VKLFAPLHLALLATIALFSVVLVLTCRRMPAAQRAVRLALGFGLVINELIWWGFRYSHGGVHRTNLPLELCDLSLWASVTTCLTLSPAALELAYFAGLGGAGWALLSPHAKPPWPSYPAVYFFVAHGAIVISVLVLVFGRICVLKDGAVWRAYGFLLGYACLIGVFNKLFGTNYLFLSTKPPTASLLDLVAIGPWPWYLVPVAAVAFALFWLLWLPASRCEKRLAARGTH
jgi:hypothetical integral membrane protein (TIGR02206 family)